MAMCLLCHSAFYCLHCFNESSKTKDGEKEKSSIPLVIWASILYLKQKTRRNDDSSESKASSSATAVGIEMKEVPETEALCPGVSSPKPEDKGKHSTCKFCTLCKSKFCRSFLSAIIWLIFFFFDGRYVACACSDWGGMHTVTDSLIWCKQTENDTMVFQKKTHQVHHHISGKF